jgi:hypothetical protein
MRDTRPFLVAQISNQVIDQQRSTRTRLAVIRHPSSSASISFDHFIEDRISSKAEGRFSLALIACLSSYSAHSP